MQVGFFDWFLGPKAADAHDPSGPVVLIATRSGAIEQALTAAGRVVSTQDAEAKDLVEAIAKAKPAVIVVEVDPPLNGFMVHKKIKAAGALRSVPTVLFSPDMDPRVFREHSQLRTRADEYLTSNAPHEIAAAIERLTPKRSR